MLSHVGWTGYLCKWSKEGKRKRVIKQTLPHSNPLAAHHSLSPLLQRTRVLCGQILSRRRKQGTQATRLSAQYLRYPGWIDDEGKNDRGIGVKRHNHQVLAWIWISARRWEVCITEDKRRRDPGLSLLDASVGATAAMRSKSVSGCMESSAGNSTTKYRTETACLDERWRGPLSTFDFWFWH